MKRIEITEVTTNESSVLLVGVPIEMKRLYQRLCKASEKGNTEWFPYYGNKPIKLGVNFQRIAGIQIFPDGSFVWTNSDCIAQLLADQY